METWKQVATRAYKDFNDTSIKVPVMVIRETDQKIRDLEIKIKLLEAELSIKELSDEDYKLWIQ